MVPKTKPNIKIIRPRTQNEAFAMNKRVPGERVGCSKMTENKQVGRGPGRPGSGPGGLGIGKPSDTGAWRHLPGLWSQRTNLENVLLILGSKEAVSNDQWAQLTVSPPPP